MTGDDNRPGDGHDTIILKTEDRRAELRPVPGTTILAESTGHFKLRDGSAVSCIYTPGAGVDVPVSWESRKIWLPAEWLVAATYLDKPGQIVVPVRSGGVHLNFEPAHKNQDEADNRAVNLYWRPCDVPVDFDWLMRQAPDQKPYRAPIWLWGECDE